MVDSAKSGVGAFVKSPFGTQPKSTGLFLLRGGKLRFVFSRRFQVSVAIGSMAALFGAIVAVNSLVVSWRPIPVDFAPASVPGLTHFHIAWRGDRVWMLSNLNGVRPDPLWRIARNWNRQPLPVMQAALPDSGLATVCPSNDLIARAPNGMIDSKIVLLGSGNRVLRTFEEDIYRSKNHKTNSGPVNLLSLSPDGKHLAAESHLFNISDAQSNAGLRYLGIVVYDVASGRQIARQSAVEGNFADFAWSPDSRELAAITVDGWVFVLDAARVKLRLKFRAHQLFGAQIAWSPDGKTLVTATNPRVALSPTHLEYDIPFYGVISVSGPKASSSSGMGKIKIVLTTNKNGDATWNGRTERLLKRFDARTGKQIGSALPLQTGAVDLAFSPDGRQLALGEHEFALLLNAQTLATERRLDIPKPATLGSSSVAAPVCLAWSEDGSTLATSRGLTLWRVR